MTNKVKPTGKVTIDRDEYDALVQTAKVTGEYLQGQKQSFDSSSKLISNLKSL